MKNPNVVHADRPPTALLQRRHRISGNVFVGLVRSWIATLECWLIRFFFPRRRASSSPALNNILVVKLDELGDVAMALPLLGALREQAPNAHITLILNSSVAGLLQSEPGLTVLSIGIRCNPVLRPLVLPARYLQFVRRHLQGKRFDACLLPRREADDVFATVLAYFTNSRRIISFTEKCSPRKAKINRGFDRLLTDALPNPPLQSDSLSNLHLLDPLGLNPGPSVPLLPVYQEAEEFARAVLPESREAYVAICPTSGHSELKQWGIERFAEVAAKITSTGRYIVLLGGPGDIELGRTVEVAAGERCINLIGKTTLQQLTAILDRCSSFIGNDAGPMHIASALGMRTIGIFGPSCHHIYGPWGPERAVVVHEVDCSPCKLHQSDRCMRCVHAERICLTQIRPADVLAEL